MTSATPESDAPTHLIVLYQLDGVKTYHSLANEAELCTHILALFEADLIGRRQRLGELGARKKLNHGEQLRDEDEAEVIQYDAADLLNYLDAHIGEIIALQYLNIERRYAPQGRAWLKNALYRYLQDQSAAR